MYYELNFVAGGLITTQSASHFSLILLHLPVDIQHQHLEPSLHFTRLHPDKFIFPPSTSSLQSAALVNFFSNSMPELIKIPKDKKKMINRSIYKHLDEYA